MPINVRDFTFISEKIPRQLIEKKTGAVTISGSIPTSGYIKISGASINTRVNKPAVYIAVTMPRTISTTIAGDVVYGTGSIPVAVSSGGNTASGTIGIDIIGNTVIPYIVLYRQSGSGVTPIATDTFNIKLWICASPSN